MNASEKVAALAPTLVADALVIYAAVLALGKARAAFRKVSGCEHDETWASALEAKDAATCAVEKIADAAALVAAANEGPMVLLAGAAVAALAVSNDATLFARLPPSARELLVRDGCVVGAETGHPHVTSKGCDVYASEIVELGAKVARDPVRETLSGIASAVDRALGPREGGFASGCGHMPRPGTCGGCMLTLRDAAGGGAR